MNKQNMIGATVAAVTGIFLAACNNVKMEHSKVEKIEQIKKGPHAGEKLAYIYMRWGEPAIWNKDEVQNQLKKDSVPAIVQSIDKGTGQPGFALQEQKIWKDTIVALK